jgi:hypothetical protein
MNSYFSTEALEALQQAYELQLTPDEMDIDSHTGLPTNVVSNTSPWHGSVDLWKYPNGVSKLETSPIMYSGVEDEDEEEYEEESDEDIVSEDNEEDEMLSDEEVDALIEELLNSDDED